MSYLWGFCSAFVLYCFLSIYFPAGETLLEASVWEDLQIQDGVVPVESGNMYDSTRDSSKEVSEKAKAI